MRLPSNWLPGQWLPGHPSYGILRRIGFLLESWGLNRRNYLVVTRPWQDWTELGPIKKRLGFKTSYRVEPWTPSTTTVRWWIAIVCAFLLGRYL